MTNSYKSYLNFVLSVDEKLKNCEFKHFSGREYEKPITQKLNNEVIEEYRNLKENITEGSFTSHQLAYQKVVVKSNNH